MNHDCARQKKDGTWGYTSANDGRVHPVGYCAPFTEFSDVTIDCIFGGDRERYEKYIAPYRAANEAGKYHDGGHATADEACECYKNYLLDFHLTFHSTSQLFDMGAFCGSYTVTPCRVAGCKAHTSAYAEVGEGGYPKRIYLCDDHHSREVVESLFSVGESWHS